MACMLRFFSLTGALFIPGVPGSSLATLCTFDDSTVLVQSFSSFEPEISDELELDKPLDKSKKGKKPLSLAARLKQRTSKIIRKKAEQFVGLLPGMPPMVTSTVAWYLHDFIMQVRLHSEGHRGFVDYFADQLADVSAEEVDGPKMWHMIHDASAHSKLERPMKEFLDEMDQVFESANQSDPDPIAMFTVLSHGFEKLGLPAEVTSIMDEFGGMLANTSASLDSNTTFLPQRLFGMMSTVYKKMGMPPEFVGLIDDFGRIFADSPNGVPDVNKIMVTMGTMLKNMGMPDAIVDFCNDLGNMITNNSSVAIDPGMVMMKVSKVMESMGAPPETLTFIKGVSQTLTQMIEGGSEPSADAVVGDFMKMIGDTMAAEAAASLQEVADPMKGAQLAQGKPPKGKKQAMLSFLQMHDEVGALAGKGAQPSAEDVASAVVPHLLATARGEPFGA